MMLILIPVDQLKSENDETREMRGLIGLIRTHCVSTLIDSGSHKYITQTGLQGTLVHVVHVPFDEGQAMLRVFAA
jgi:hypothetical protein